MESDLPLIDMDEEDDDALIPLPNQTPSKSSFSFSPLATNIQKDMEKASSSSVKATNNKENINSNNVQVPKLGMKPMPMKMRNKGAGYNLRKSLAWDRAFFTDEGILDPYELNLITGINDISRGGVLPVISEEGNSSCSSASRYKIEPNDSEDYVEVVSKESRGKSCTLKGKREKTCSSMAKQDSSVHHKVTQKVISSDRTNRVRSKVGGSSAHIAASSLKRPENPNILKTTNKDSKLPKIPISKAGSCISATTKGSIRPPQSGHSMIPRPTTNVQKDFGLKSSIKNQPSSQTKAKTGPVSRSSSSKQLPKRTIRNSTNSSSKAVSSTKSRLVQADTTNSGSKTVPDRSQLYRVQEESTSATKTLANDTATNSVKNNLTTEAPMLNSSGHYHNQRDSDGPMNSDRLHICESKDRPASPAAPQHMNFYNTGVYTQNIEPARPSGLRLPSPSLRFFDQNTASEFVPLQQKINQQSNSNMSSNRIIDNWRPPTVPTRTPMKISNIDENICSELATPDTSCFNSKLSMSPSYMANTTKRVPYSNMYSHTERENEPRVDINHMMVQYERRRSGLESHKITGQKNQILRYVKNMELDKITCKSDEEATASHIEEDKQQKPNDVSTSVEHVLTRVDGNPTILQDPTQTLTEQSDTEKSDSHTVNLESYVLLQHENTEQENDIEVVDVKNEPIEADARCNTDSSCSGTKVSNIIRSKHSLKDEARNEGNINALELKSSVSTMDTVKGHNDTDSSDVLSTAVEAPVLYKHPSAEGIHIDPSVFIENKSPIQDSSTVNSQLSSEGLFVNCSQVQGPCGDSAEINDYVIQETRGSESVLEVADDALEEKRTLFDVVLDREHVLTDNNRVCMKESLSPKKIADFDQIQNALESFVAVQEERVSHGCLLPNSDTSYHIFHKEPVSVPDLSVGDLPNELQGLVGIEPPIDTYDTNGQSGSCNQDAPESNVLTLCVETTSTTLSSVTAELGSVAGGDENILTISHCIGEDEAEGFKEEDGPMVDEFQHEFDSGNDLEKNKDATVSIEQVLTDNNRACMKESLSPEKSTDVDKLHNALDSFVAVQEESVSHQCLLPNSDAISHIFHMEQASFHDICVGGLPNELQGFVEPPIETYDTNGQSGSCNQDPSESNSLTTCVETMSTTLASVTTELCSFAGGFGSMLTSSHSLGEKDEADGLKEEDSLMVDEFHHEFDSESNLKENKDATMSIEQVLTNNNRVCMRESLSLEKIADLDQLQNALESFIAVPEKSVSHQCLLPNSDASSHIFHMEQASVPDLSVGDLPNELQGFVGIEPPIEMYDTNVQSGSFNQDPSESNSLTTCVETTCTTLPSVTTELCSVAVGDESMLTSSYSLGEKDEAEGLKEEDSLMVDEFHHEFDSGNDLKKNKDATMSIEQVLKEDNCPCMKESLSPEKIVDVDKLHNALESFIAVQEETTGTTLPSVTAESGSVAGGDESMLTSSVSIGEKDEAEGLKKEDSTMVDELHHEFDSGSDLEKTKDPIVSIKSSNNIKRLDNSLVIHPPNAVPFSDEWLAAIEAAGEEILSMKCGAVQHSPPDKSVPEPSPWSPVKKKTNQLGPYDCTKYMNAMPSDPH